MTRWGIISALLIAATLGSLRLQAQTLPQESSEYQVKAAFLYNFVKFVEWPAGGEPARQIELCVLGVDPFGSVLDRAVEGKTVNGRRLIIRRISDVSAARSCQVLFVSQSEAGRVNDVIRGVLGWSVLTVSEIERFSERGGIIAFLMDGQRVRFRISPKAAAMAGLTISSKLLQLAVAAQQGKDR